MARCCFILFMQKPIRSIPIYPAEQMTARQRYRAAKPGDLVDSRGRVLRDLRISIIDRCNFRCTYCMPREVFDENHPFLPRNALLDFEEICRLARIFVKRGVRKIRLTGGEPLLRKDAATLVSMLKSLGGIEVTLTTNGVLLPQFATELKKAGLDRLTVSLDALNESIFQRLCDSPKHTVKDVLNGINAAQAAGFESIKINAVIKRGANEDQILPLAKYFRGTGHILRFIEFMDVGSSNGWKLDDVVTAKEILETIHAVYPIVPINPNYPGEVAKRWQYEDGRGELGVITSVTRAFCSSCCRLRLSTEGKLFTCLFAHEAKVDLRALLRQQVSDELLDAHIAQVWHERQDRYSELRTENTKLPVGVQKIEMSYIGG